MLFFFFLLSFSCQLTGMEQSHPRAQLSFPGTHIPAPEHPFATSARQVTNFSWQPVIWWARTFSVSCQHKEGCAAVTARGKKAFRSLTPGLPAHSTEVTSSCVSGSLSNSQLHCKGTAQPQKKPSHLGEERHWQCRWMLCVRDKSCSRSCSNLCCTAQAAPGGKGSKNPEPELWRFGFKNVTARRRKFWEQFLGWSREFLNPLDNLRCFLLL